MILSRLFHPSLKKLHRWADGEDVPIDKHLATCEYCAARLDPLLDESDDRLRAALLRLLTVPEELPARMKAGMDEHLSNQRDLQLIGEFFALPYRTARVMTSTDEGDD